MYIFVFIKMNKCKYVPTKTDKEMLDRYKNGLSIGFTWKSSLKSKGLIPRSSGKYLLGSKYSSSSLSSCKRKTRGARTRRKN